jgi:hypothetical protein
MLVEPRVVTYESNVTPFYSYKQLMSNVDISPESDLTHNYLVYDIKHRPYEELRILFETYFR